MPDINQTERIEFLEKQKKELQREIRKLKRKPDRIVGFFFLIIGFPFLILAFIYTHYVSAFIGVALTFWGSLLLYIRPFFYIRKEILNSTFIESHEYFHRLLDELNFKGIPIYVAPKEGDSQRNVFIFLPSSNNPRKSSEELTKSERIIMDDSSGIILTPPGLGLSWLIEDELRDDLLYSDLTYLNKDLEKAIVEGLEIAKVFEMRNSENKILVRINGSIFDDIMRARLQIENTRNLGDPLSSAIACILAKWTQNPITIESARVRTRTNIIELTFNILE